MDRVSKIRVEGGFYNELNDIDIRTEDKHRVTTIYGSNGSGKSSIANAIDEYKNSENIAIKEFSHISFLSKDLNQVDLSKDDKNNIWVYSENYIEKNINWDNDNLGAIVMFGEQIEIDSEIQKKNIEYKIQIDEHNQIDTDKYFLEKGDFSINSALETIRSILRKNWADRDKKIRDLKSSPVTESVLTQITTSIKDNITYNKLLIEYESKEKEFLFLNRNLDKLPLFKIETISEDDFESIRNLLKKKNTKYNGSEIEDKLLDLIINGKRNLIVDSFNHFSNNHNDCPYCMQTVSDKHRNLLLSSIKSLFNEELEQQSNELNFYKEKLIEIDLDLDYLRKHQNETIIEFVKNIEYYNNIIVSLREMIDKKINNPFEPILVEDVIIDAAKMLKFQSDELFNYIKIFNEKIDSIQNFREHIIELNRRLARLEIDDAFKKWNSLKANYNFEIEKKNKVNEKIRQLLDEINELSIKKNRVDIALKDINNNLLQIFSGKNRLSLDLDSNLNYRIKSRGKIIKLKKLSTGERNVISLCYFFAHLRNNTDAIKLYSNPYFIVLDDPISSLDFDNKIGIYAFLRKTLGDILKNNEKSRILILTHDLDVVYKFDKVFDDLGKYLNNKSFNCVMRLLTNKKTKSINIRSINNYRWNIDDIYDYAISNIDDENINDYYIGNILRKTLEAYSTFNFREDFSGLTQNEEILNKIQDSDLKEYFKNRMIRLLLNSESHTKEIATSIIDHDSFEQFGKEEKIQISKDVLCLLYSLDKEHIKSYLSDDNIKIKNIEKWIQNCRKLSID